MSIEDNPENPEGPNPQIQISTNQAVGFIAAGVQSGNRLGLQALQRKINRTPGLRTRLGRFSDVYTLGRAASGEALELPAFGALNSIQTNLAVDQFTGGDATTMPSAQVMNEGIKQSVGGINVLTEQLEECCTTIVEKLFDIENRLKKVVSSIQESLGEIVVEISNIFNDSLNAFENRLNDRFEKRLDSLEKNLSELIISEATRVVDNQDLRFKEFDTYFVALFPKVNHIVETVNTLDSKVTALDGKIDVLSEKVTALDSKINSLDGKIDVLKITLDQAALVINEIETSLNFFSKTCLTLLRSQKELLNSLIEQVKVVESVIMSLDEQIKSLNTKADALTTELNEVAVGVAGTAIDLSIFTPLCLEGLGGLATELLAGFAANETSIAGVELTIKVKSIVDTKKYNNHIDSKITELESFSEKKIKEEHEYWDDKTEKLPKLVAREASLAIIGEPYYRYDAISCYYPTIVFIFYEVNPLTKPRRAQIKLRLKETTENLTTARITELKNKVLSASNLTFIAGSTRANYVSADKRMKTTIYSKDSSTAEYILKSVFSLISDTFDEKLLSITTNGINRPNLSKRKNPLNNIGLNTSNYKEPFEVKLHHAHLVVNGLKEIIPIWETE